MKILLKLAGFGGGAPLSVLQYGRILKNHGFSVVVDGSRNNENIDQKYIKSGIPVNYSNNLTWLVEKRKFIKLLYSVFEIYNSIISNQIETIISVSHINIYFCSYICRCLGINHLIIVAGGDLAKNSESVKYWVGNRIICFSQENKDAVMSRGQPEDKIKIISNRISCEEDYSWKAHYSEMGKTSPIVLLMTSRLDTGKTESIKAIMEVTKWLFLNNQNVVLRVAGGGSEFEEIKFLAQEINQEVNKELIIILGYVDNIKQEFHRAHFVFGKGRSVLEPIMMNRIGFVVGEDKKISLCEEKSVENLYYYNFAGRNISCYTSKKDIYDLINKIQYKTIDVEEFYKIFENVRVKYHSDYFENNFYPVFEKECIKNKKKSFRGKFTYKILLCYAVFNYIKLLSINKIKKILWRNS